MKKTNKNKIMKIGIICLFLILASIFITSTTIRDTISDFLSVNITGTFKTNNISSYNGNITFHNASGTEWMRLTNDGKIGIGTAIPSHILEVSGSMNVSGDLNVSGTLIVPTIRGVTSFTAGGDLDIGAYELKAQTLEADIATGTAPLTIASTTQVSNLNVSASAVSYNLIPNQNIDIGAYNFTADTNILYVDSTNNRVGIGTTTPDLALNVVGDINITGNYTIGVSTTPGAATDACSVGTLTADDNYIYFCNSTGNWTRAALSSW